MSRATSTTEAPELLGSTLVFMNAQLDLGYTDLVGELVFSDAAGLVLVAPSGHPQVLGKRSLADARGGELFAPEGHILIEEGGLVKNLPAALIAQGYCIEVARHKGLSDWGFDVVELRVIT